MPVAGGCSILRRMGHPGLGRVQMNMASGIREFARATPQAVAVVDGSRRLTYAQLMDRSVRLANSLRAHGLSDGDRVALLSGNRLEYPEVATAAAIAGLVLVPLNPRLTAGEVAYIVGHSGATSLVLDDHLADRAAEAVAAGGLRCVLSMDGTALGEPYDEALAGASSRHVPSVTAEGDPFGIFYSAGTTGQPKGIVVSHRARVLTAFCSAVEWGLGPGRRTVAVAPLYHGAGFSFGYAGVQLGGTLVMLPSFDPEHLLDLVEKERPSTMFLVPTHAHMLRALGADVVRRTDLSSLETLYFDAAPLPHALKLWILEAFPGIRLHELYGSTEAGIVTDLRPEDQLRKQRCAGQPWFMTELRVVDDEGAEVGFGGTGELYSRSPFLMNGYWRDDAGTQACTTADGFLSAGDVAHLDDEGYVYIVDRKKDMIISGGVNIYPREVEETLMAHPSVAEAAVVGVASEKWGEDLKAYVVLRPGHRLDAAAIEAHCRSQLAGFKVPRQIEALDALPRNAAGKVLKRALGNGAGVLLEGG
ncbi:MAG: class I adenylate-forming enzyme family protein [Acidimicrobiales bacterium]